MEKYFKWIMLAVVVLGVVGIVFFIRTQKEKPLPGMTVPIVGQTHVPDGTIVTHYNSNPPTSGDHYQVPLNWGVYSEPVQDEKAVHNLEHGGVWVTYNCNIPADGKEPKDFDASSSASPEIASKSAVVDSTDCKSLIGTLEGITKGYRSKVFLSPRSKNDSRVAIVSWGRIWKMNKIDIERVKEFIQLNRNRGPEFVPDM